MHLTAARICSQGTYVRHCISGALRSSPPLARGIPARQPITPWKHSSTSLAHVIKPRASIAIISAARGLSWRLSTATTGMQQTNGVAENCVRRTREGGGSGSVQSGFNPQTLWPEAGEHYCLSTNIAIIDGDSSYNRRHKQGHFQRRFYPLWCHGRFHAPARHQGCLYGR